MSTQTDLAVHIYACPADATDDLVAALGTLRLAPDPDAAEISGIAATWTGSSWAYAIDEAITALEAAGATFDVSEAGTADTLPALAWGAPGHNTFSRYATVDGDPLIPLSTFEALAATTGVADDMASTTGAAVRGHVRLAKQQLNKEN